MASTPPSQGGAPDERRLRVTDDLLQSDNNASPSSSPRPSAGFPNPMRMQLPEGVRPFEPQAWGEAPTSPSASPTFQQQQSGSPHAAAYVVRSPSRLRYSQSTAGRSSPLRGSASIRERAGQPLNRFVKVEHVPGEAGQDDIHIEHLEPDEAQRAAEVDTKIIKQVDDLVAYFNSLYQDDQINVSELENELEDKDLLLEQKDEIIRRLMVGRGSDGMPMQPSSAPVLPQFDPGHERSGRSCWTWLADSWRQRRCLCLSLIALALLLLLLTILLAVLLTRKEPSTAPSFLYTPVLLSAGNTTLNLQLALSHAGSVAYVVVLANSSAGRDGAGAGEVGLAATGAGLTGLEASAVACGQLTVPRDHYNYTLSITSANSLECRQLAAAAGAGAQVQLSCSRCPLLSADTAYSVLMVAKAGDASSGTTNVLASTAPPWASRPPKLLASPSAAATGESAFSLTFAVDAPGRLRYLVLYANMYARFMDTYVVFENQVTRPQDLLTVDRAAFADGLVARGSIAPQTPGANYSCTIGGDANGNSLCSCDPGASCNSEGSCFGSLCQFSLFALAPNTTYKVILLPESQDGLSLGSPVQLPPFTTQPPVTPPQPSRDLQVSPVVGPSSFQVQSIQQSKPGFAYVIVTKPVNQAAGNVLPGTTTPFNQAPSGRRRTLLQAQSPLPTYLPNTEPVATEGGGDAFQPPCGTPAPCRPNQAVQDYVNTANEALVAVHCLPIAEISSDPFNLTQAALQNNTLYKVMVIPTDLSDNQDQWTALVRTQDLTPPVLTVVGLPPPTESSLSSIVQLDEPGTVYVGLWLARSDAQVTKNATCPPTFNGTSSSVAVFDATLPVPAARANVTILFNSSLTANTHYMMYMIAVDAYGNCQANFTVLPIQTADNIPPVLSVSATVPAPPAGGTSASLNIQLDEPGTAYYLVMQQGGPACPAPDQLFPPGPIAPPGATVPPGGIGHVLVDQAGSNAASVPLTGLTSQTGYIACVAAKDVWDNKVARTQEVAFVTLDITAPVATLAVLPGSDGQVTCDRTTYTCGLTFSTTLDEPGNITWALVPSTELHATLPATTAMYSQAAAALYPSLLASGNITAAAANTSVPALPTNPAGPITYVVVAAAVDTAGNVQPTLYQANAVAPDITPPRFLVPPRQSQANDSAIFVTAQLSESSSIIWVALPSPAAAPPTVAEVLAGTGAAGAAPAANGTAGPTAGNSSYEFVANGLGSGREYDVFLVARDLAGNVATNVTSIIAAHTTDRTPPTITTLTATFTPPMNFSLTAAASKAGSLYFIARLPSQPAPANVQEVILAATSASNANFTGSLALSAPNAAASTGIMCVADGGQFVVYGVAQDRQGRWPQWDEWPNNSTITAINVTVISPVSTTCPLPQQFLAPLRTQLVLGLSGPGLPLGTHSSTFAPVTGAVTWSQGAGAFAKQPARAPAAVGVQAAGIALPGAITLPIKPYPPAAVSVLVRTYTLVPEDNSQQGQTLQLSFQLRDAAGRTHVDTIALVVQPTLRFASGAPAGVAANSTALQNCDVSTLNAASGVGDCAVPLQRSLFPAAGAAQATVTLTVLVGANIVATSQPSQLVLAAPPTQPTPNPASASMVVVLPYRPVYIGETIKVSVVASNPTSSGITGFTVPLRYNTLFLRYIGATASSLWLPVYAPQVLQVSGTDAVQPLSVGARAVGQPNNLYQSSTSIPLVDVYFTVLSQATAPLVSLYSVPNTVPPLPSLAPFGSVPPVQVSDYRGGAHSSGALNITGSPATVGIWAHADAHDIYNTAVLNGAAVTVPLHATAVPNFGAPVAVAGAACSAVGAGSAFALVGCSVAVRASSSGAVKGAQVQMSYQGFLASVTLSIWFPSNVTVTAEDTTLHSLLPINANLAQLTPSCSGWYQSTRLAAFADWSNGGGTAADTVAGTDITALPVSFAANDSRVAQVQGAVVQGVAVPLSLPSAPVTVSLSGSALNPVPSVLVTVSNAPVCLTSVAPLATTGVQFAPVTPPSPLANSTVRLAWTPQQDLTWETSSAAVLTYATFSDGQTIDVTQRAGASVAVVGGGNAFALRLNNLTNIYSVDVTSKVGSAQACGAFLSASLGVCSIPLGSGAGTVNINLPQPTRVSNFAATPTTIAAALNPASTAPIDLPTTAVLSVAVAFSDVSSHDFSSDPRAVPYIASGVSLCQLTQAPGGSWSVVALSASLSGSCSVKVNITFAGGVVLTSPPAQVLVVAAQATNVYALPPNSLALPSTNDSVLAPWLVAPTPGVLTLLKCDWRNYDQRTIWALEQLSNCTSSATNSCNLVDINDASYLSINSSTPAVATVMAGYPSGLSGYPTYPLLGNRLVPYTPGVTTLSVQYGQVGAVPPTQVTVSVQETYHPGWPKATVVGDTSVTITANMTTNYTVMFQAVAAGQLDLVSNPPTAVSVQTSGIQMIKDESRGPFFYTYTTTSLTPATNYTILLVVQAGLTLSSGVTAITGILTPDTQPPSFLKAQVTQVTSDPSSGRFSASLDVSISEVGFFAYAIYGDPACITADPTVAEVRAAANLATAGKCNCSAAFCAARSIQGSGNLTVPTPGVTNLVTLTGTLPPSPYESLRGSLAFPDTQLFCTPYTMPSTFASRSHTIFMVAEDNFPTYQGWNSSCNPPAPYSLSIPPGPCNATALAPCVETPPATEANNVQSTAGGYALIPDMTLTPPPPIPAQKPIQGVFTVADPTPIAFTMQTPSVSAIGTTITFGFQLSKPGLLRYQLQTSSQVVAFGMYPAFDTQPYNVTISRACSGAPLVSAAYALFYNATDNYGNSTAMDIQRIAL